MESQDAIAHRALIPGMPTLPEPPSPPEPDVLLRALELTREGRQCDAALAELREFRVSDEGVTALARHAQSHPNTAGCAALSLGARMMYHEQLKAYLDQELEMEARDAIMRFDGTPEAELLQHALAVFSAYASDEELDASHDFFARLGEDARADDKYPHFKFLRLVAARRLIERRAVRSKEFRSDVEPLSAELDQLSQGRQASIVLRQARARMGA